MALTKVQSAVTNSGVVNVLDFGATGDGVTDDFAAFQAAINSTVNGKMATIHIPPGSYAGALSSLNLGTRVVLWVCEAEPTFVSSVPLGTVSRVDYRSDNTRPWTVNGYGFGKNITTGLNTDGPALRVDRYANHTGGTVGGSSEPSGFVVVHNVYNTALNYETGAQVITTHQGGNSNQNIVALHTETRKAGNGAAGTFGLNIVVQDQTNNASSVSGGSLLGAEFTGSVGGADDAASRHMIDVVMKSNSSALGGGGYTTGLRVRTSDAATRAANVTNGIMVQEGAGGGTMTTGIRVNNDGTQGIYDEGSKTVGINLQGTYSSNAIRVKGGDKYGFETTGAITMAYNTPVVAFANGGVEKVGLSVSGTAGLRGLRVDSTRVVGPQGAAVADATDVSTAISGLNSLLARLRVHGLIDT